MRKNRIGYNKNMTKLKDLTKNSVLIIVVIFLVVIVMIFYNKEKLFFSFIHRSEISKEIVEDEELRKNGNQSETKSQWLNNQKKLYELSSTKVNFLLEEIWQRFPEKEERLKALAILHLNTPYQLGCLGEESGRDKDPIFRLDVTDCTAFILTNTALLLSKDLEEAQEMMKSLNYRTDKNIIFENRLHFTIDRNITSPYFRDITEEIAGIDRMMAINLVLNKVKEDSSRLIDINWEREVVLKYIPHKYITENLIDKLPKSVGIAFIRKEDAQIGLDVAHEGFLFDNQLFLHASSIEKKVVAINFWDYYFTED
ncbi:DUF1460 domain-containing protein, partial [candidate division WOR-3 bacterium]|nr:DUF1460 domain-containing protein [candidate division WOR-3 bacterium]